MCGARNAMGEKVDKVLILMSLHSSFGHGLKTCKQAQKLKTVIWAVKEIKRLL